MKYFDTDDAYRQAMQAGLTMMLTKSKDEYNKMLIKQMDKAKTILNKKFGIAKRGNSK